MKSIIYIIRWFDILILNLGIGLCGPLAKDGTPDPHLAAAHGNGALKVLAHAHAQLEPLRVEAELPGDEVALLAEGDKVLVLGVGGGGLAAGDGADGHEAEEVEAGGAVLEDLAAQGDGVRARGAARLGVLARGVDLDVDGELGEGGIGGEEGGAGGAEEAGLFEGVDAGDAEEVGDLGEVLAVACFPGTRSTSQSVCRLATHSLRFSPLK